MFAFGAAGDLHCVSLDSGTKLWSRELANEYSAKEGYFGVGSTPIVIANRVLVNVGGEDSTGIVALDPESGKTLWTAAEEGASYSSPTTYTDQGELRGLFVTRLNAVGIRPTNGEILFRFPFGKRGPTVNAATPIMVDTHRVFLSASYRIGCVLLRIDGKKTEAIWGSDDVMSSQYPTAIFHAGYLYGIHGREDGPPAELRCVDASSGKVVWKKVGFGMAHLILADNKLLVLRTDGRLLLLAPTPEEYRELASAQILAEYGPGPAGAEPRQAIFSREPRRPRPTGIRCGWGIVGSQSHAVMRSSSRHLPAEPIPARIYPGRAVRSSTGLGNSLAPQEGNALWQGRFINTTSPSKSAVTRGF